MIKQVLLDGVSVTNDLTFLSMVRDGASATSDVRTYSRGGRSGITLGLPFYRGFFIQMEFTIIGRTYTELVEQRDRLARFFRVKPDKEAIQSKVLSFVMANDTVREAPCIFSPYVGSVNSTDGTRTIIQVTAQTEIEYLTNPTDLEQTITIQDLGGFSVPFDVPFSIANKSGADYTDQGGVSVINNLGNAEYYPIITFNGPLNIFTLFNDTTGKSISYNNELESSDKLVLDMYNRTAVKNGITNDLVYIDDSPDWWWLDPGNNSIRLVAGGGTGNAVIKYRHAYRGI